MYNLKDALTNYSKLNPWQDREFFDWKIVIQNVWLELLRFPSVSLLEWDTDSDNILQIIGRDFSFSSKNVFNRPIKNLSEQQSEFLGIVLQNINFLNSKVIDIFNHSRIEVLDFGDYLRIDTQAHLIWRLDDPHTLFKTEE
jgi:hypothetical protein